MSGGSSERWHCGAEGTVCRRGASPAALLGGSWVDGGGVSPPNMGLAEQKPVLPAACPLLPIPSPPAPSAACEGGGSPSPPHRGWTSREQLLSRPRSPLRSSPTVYKGDCTSIPPTTRVR